jgi:circadian clock protein KaiC
MLGIGGYYRGSSVLVSGLAGTGKSTFGAAFIDAGCQRGERCLYFAFEESPDQVVRNMHSVGIDLKPHIDAGLLRIEAARPTLFGFEMHLARMHRDIVRFDPALLMVDPISAFRGPPTEIHATLVRLVDLCKTRGITTMFTSLSAVGEMMNESERNISSLMDTWISLKDVEENGERNRVLALRKSRGMNHSNQMREYKLTGNGIALVEAYIGPDGVLTGSARLAQEARERAETDARQQQIHRQHRDVARRRAAIERQIQEMRAELEAEEAEIMTLIAQDEARENIIEADRGLMATRRGVKR